MFGRCGSSDHRRRYHRHEWRLAPTSRLGIPVVKPNCGDSSSRVLCQTRLLWRTNWPTSSRRSPRATTRSSKPLASYNRVPLEAQHVIRAWIEDLEESGPPAIVAYSPDGSPIARIEDTDMRVEFEVVATPLGFPTPPYGLSKAYEIFGSGKLRSRPGGPR